MGTAKIDMSEVPEVIQIKDRLFSYPNIYAKKGIMWVHPMVYIKFEDIDKNFKRCLKNIDKMKEFIQELEENIEEGIIPALLNFMEDEY